MFPKELEMGLVKVITIFSSAANSKSGVTTDAAKPVVSMTLTARNGTKWMSILSNIAVPIIFIFGIISIVLAVKSCGGM